MDASLTLRCDLKLNGHALSVQGTFRRGIRIRRGPTGYDALAVVPAVVMEGIEEDGEAVDGDSGEADIEDGLAGETDGCDGSGGQERAHEFVQAEDGTRMDIG
jgi:hypothetical protein